MYKFPVFFLVATVTLSAFGATSRKDLNMAISVNYGTVESVEKVKLKSDAPRNAVFGGIIGAATSGSHHRGKHAAEGALAAALVTALVQHRKSANQYLVDLKSGGSLKLITEQGDIRVGDCVSVEQGSAANIRRVSSVYCEHAGHIALDHPVVQAKAQLDAAGCHAAKEQALKADTEESVDIALKKVRVFCDT
jgi:outer membrane lipoprotein SlyB